MKYILISLMLLSFTKVNGQKADSIYDCSKKVEIYHEIKNWAYPGEGDLIGEKEFTPTLLMNDFGEFALKVSIKSYSYHNYRKKDQIKRQNGEPYILYIDTAYSGIGYKGVHLFKDSCILKQEYANYIKLRYYKAVPFIDPHKSTLKPVNQ